MPQIGLIDDKKEQRESIIKLISNYLDNNYSGWGCIDTYPFKDDISQYVSWICEHDIAVLVVDEQLQEEASPDGGNVDYNAHDLIDFIRNSFPTFPVFALTAYSVTPELIEKNGSFDDILEKNYFSDNLESIITRFVRAGQRFTEVNQEELTRLSQISKDLAEGKKVEQDKLDEATAIQQRLEIPFTIERLSTRSEVLNEFDNQLKEMEKLANEIRIFLK